MPNRHQTPDDSEGRITRQVVEIEDSVARQMVEALSVQLPAMVSEAVRTALGDNRLTEDERQWVRAAIQAQAKSAAFRHAVVTKGLGGLLTAACVWLSVEAWHWLRHIFNRGI